MANESTRDDHSAGSSSILARIRAALTALVAVIVVAVLVAGVVAGLFLGIGVVWGAVFGGDSPGGAIPVASFDVTTDSDGATLTHDGGESISATELYIIVEGEPRGSWAELADSNGDVSEGDSITVDGIEEGQEVHFQWIDDERDTEHVVDRETA